MPKNNDKVEYSKGKLSRYGIPEFNVNIKSEEDQETFVALMAGLKESQKRLEEAQRIRDEKKDDIKDFITDELKVELDGRSMISVKVEDFATATFSAATKSVYDKKEHNRIIHEDPVYSKMLKSLIQRIIKNNDLAIADFEKAIEIYESARANATRREVDKDAGKPSQFRPTYHEEDAETWLARNESIKNDKFAINESFTESLRNFYTKVVAYVKNICKKIRRRTEIDEMQLEKLKRMFGKKED